MRRRQGICKVFEPGEDRELSYGGPSGSSTAVVRVMGLLGMNSELGGDFLYVGSGVCPRLITVFAIENFWSFRNIFTLVHICLSTCLRLLPLAIQARSTFTMEEKPEVLESSASSHSPSITKPTTTHQEHSNGTHKHLTKAEEIAQIDALATAPGVTIASFAHLDEAAILRKMDLRLIPMLALLYLLSFLDRGNIGNAKIEGLTEDLHMTGPQYNWCLTVFFFTYAAFEVPSNLLLKRLRPSIWLPTIMVAWGVVMTLMGIVQNYHGLLAARLFLGVTEAG
ncbi:MFS general substrate transporter [Lepidopterella palustris CBS 459.81]|uniref:MFS general substrate transporter n=1 Tax=Lepidopterella palustris CBS 459.81 TaxID=1314670 RepID=A0A8E2EEU7_9PEZI|nr:MFS general substrate transporter [Lepidopterella palustris CBS 459.81]